MNFLNENGLSKLWGAIVSKFVSKEDGKGLSTNDYTNLEKEKLNKIENGATKTIVDSALSTSSSNPVQNKVVSASIENLQSQIDTTINSIPTISMVNVKDYGAVGDGVTDDQAAIQTAINENDNVYLPEGTYFISEPIALWKNRQHIYCDGEIKTNECTAFKITGHANTLYIRAIYSVSDWTGCGIQLGDTGYVPYYNTIDVGFITKMQYGIRFAPNGSGSGVAYTTIRFKEISANIGIYFNSGADSGSFINANTFIGGALSCSCPIKTEKGGSIDPFNGNTFYSIALEWCDGGMELDWFQHNHFVHCRFSKWENYWQTFATLSENCEGNTFNWIGYVFVDQIVDRNTGIPNKWDGLLRYNDGTIEINIGKCGHTTTDGMIIKERDRYYSNTVLPNQAEVDFSNQPYAIEGNTYYANDLTTYMTLKLPNCYGYSSATYFYVYIGTEEGTVLISQETNGSTHYLSEVKGSGLYKLECNDACGWHTTKVDLDTVNEIKNLNASVATKADITNGQYAVTAISEDGVSYTASVPSITSLTTGVSFIMIPSRTSASTSPTLNVNGLGAKNIKRRISAISTATQVGCGESWIAGGNPFRVIYDGTQWIIEGLTQPIAADLYGTLSVEKGGTGATDAATALSNLGGAPSVHSHEEYALNNHWHAEYSVEGHSHSVIVSGNQVIFPLDNGDTPCIVIQNNGQNNFAVSRDALNNQNLGYHVYTDGAWAGYHTLFSSSNLSFTLEGSTLKITKS